MRFLTVLQIVHIIGHIINVHSTTSPPKTGAKRLNGLFVLQSSIFGKDETMKNSTIDKATSDKISFLTYIVPAFADAYKMNVQEAFFYLKKYGAWDFLNEHWWALHTDNVLYTLNDLYEVCRDNGGLR